MKDKLIELFGAIPPFFMVAIEGKRILNKPRVWEGVMITVGSGVVMYLLLSWFALPSAVKDVKSQLNYIEKTTTEIKKESKDIRLELEATKQNVSRIDAIQQERIRRENRAK